MTAATTAQKQRQRDYMREYHRTHPTKPLTPEQRERRCIAARDYYKRNKAARLAAQRQWRASNPGKRCEQGRRYRANNKDSLRARQAAHYAKLTPTEKLARSLRIQCSTYGITVAEFHAMVAHQRGCCAICGVKPKGRLDIDHNHGSGAVRGLLCRRCNLAVGFVESGGGVAFARKLVAYIQRTLA